MQKLETLFSHFRFNYDYQHGPIKIMWYVLEQGEDESEYARCFTPDELSIFQKWINAHPDNFPSSGDISNKNYYNCSEEECPDCDGPHVLLPLQNARFPNNIIIRKEPDLNTKNEIYHCMDVIITTSGDLDKHDYDLDFIVIGEIQ